MSVAPPSRYSRARFRTHSSAALVRPKPNLSLSIPPPSGGLPSLMKSAIGLSATGLLTPSAMSLATAQDQRIQTPSEPPPIGSEINLRSVERFMGTPTDPFTPSLGTHQPASLSLNRLTQRAMAAGTPVLMRDSSAFPLASPLVAHRPPGMKRSNSVSTTATPGTPGGYFKALIGAPPNMRRSSSFCTPDTSTPGGLYEAPGTPGGYFRPFVAAPYVVKRSVSSSCIAPDVTPSALGGYSTRLS